MRYLVAEIQAVKATLARQWDRIGECGYCLNHSITWRRASGYHICRSCLQKQADAAQAKLFQPVV